MELAHRSDQELLSDVTKLVGSHRDITTKLVMCLAEIEERRLHLQAGFSSMFEFCVKKLGLGEGEAFRRIVAARLARRFPVVYSLLASGAVHLSSLELLSKRLTEENHAELLEAVSGKSKREVEALLATRFPRPAVPSSIRSLPVSAVVPGVGDSRSTPAFRLDATLGSGGRAAEPSENSHAHVPARTRIEQLSEAQFRVEFTASAELREKLELCRDLMSHSNPSRDLALVIERAVDSLLVHLEKKRLARTKRPRPEQVPRRSKSGRIANAVRRQVFERDGLRCTYVSPDGRCCEARAFLELDHADPRALGGSDEAENLRVRCRAHNQLWAEQVFGLEHIESARHFRWKKWGRPDGGGRSTQPEVPETKNPETKNPETKNPETKNPETKNPETNGASLGVLEKVHLALRGMGFRDAQARRAVLQVRSAHDEPPPIEQSLREALFFATKKSA
jgi:5-methylcytosine-specific restriction endonuclease McrA